MGPRIAWLGGAAHHLFLGDAGDFGGCSNANKLEIARASFATIEATATTWRELASSITKTFAMEICKEGKELNWTEHSGIRVVNLLNMQQTSISKI